MRKILLLAVAVALAVPSQAKCDKSMAERLKFLLPYAAANFAAIKGDVASPGDAASGIGGQYHFSSAAAAWCPNAMILEETPAHDKYPAFWEVKFDASMPGTGDDVALSLIKTYSPILKAAGFQDKPYGNPGDDPGTYHLEWDGPSDTWVTIETFRQDDKPDAVGYEIKIAHDVK